MLSLAARSVLIFLLSCSLAGAAPHMREFRIIGPGGGGAMFNPTISPQDPNTVLVACDMTGSYITHNGGKSWRMFNLEGRTRFFVFDPNDPRTIYAEGIGLWRSTDNGTSWALIYPKPSNITGVKSPRDEAGETLLTKTPSPMGRITALAIDPANSKVLYAAGGTKGSRSIFLSRDGGSDWKKEAALPEAAQHIWVDPASHRRSRTLIVAGAHFVLVAGATGIRRFAMPAPGGAADATAGFAGPHQSIIYVISDRSAFVSHDLGSSWQKVTLPGSGARVRAVAASFHHPDTAYLSYAQLHLGGQVWHGVARTTNGGRTWKLVWKEDMTPAPNVHDAWLTAAFGTDWGENPLMLGVSPQDPKICYATDFGRTMATTDGGKNWYAKYSRRVRGGGWTTTGLNVTTNYGVQFDPFDPKHMVIDYTDIGLFRSEDGGASWQTSSLGVPRLWRNTTYWTVFDPKVKGLVWGAFSGVHDLPRTKDWRHRSPLTYTGGVGISTDGGRTWKPSNGGMPPTSVTDIVLDPSSPAGKRTLYATGFGRGVYKSVDNGRTWMLKNNGIAGQEPFAWRMARAGDGTLYLVVARRSSNGSIGNTGDGALYRSRDGAEHWVRLHLPANVNGPNGIAVDVKDPQRLYLAAWARDAGNRGVGGGIYLSADGGRTWSHVLKRDQHVYDVTVDPANPDLLYAAGFDSSAWRSTDRGEHWSRIEGFDFKWGHRVILDPYHPSEIYITTYGGSVWHGPASGAPRPYTETLTPIPHSY